MTVSKAVYKCPVCGYITHFEKALEAHQKHRKHFLTEKVEEVVETPAKEQEVVQEEPVTETEEVAVVKKTRKPRVKKTAEEKENNHD